MRMGRVHRLLLAVALILGLSVLLTGGLSIYLTLAQVGDENAPTAEAMEPTLAPLATSEPRIAFVSDEEGDPAIYVMDADGSNRQRVSSQSEELCLFPSWSPDGNRVAFLGLSEGTGATVWVTDLDDSTPLPISHPVSDTSSQGLETLAPNWSFGGEQLAFVSLTDSANAALQVAGADGSGVDHTIPLTGYVAVALRRSPVSERFLLVGSHQGGESNLYTVSVHSGGPTLIMTGTTAADWSPDGERIAVAERVTKSVLVLEGDEEPRSVAQFSTTPIDVRWSPDGSRMAVVTAGSERQGYGDALYVVDAESGEVTPLVDVEAWALWPAWSSDGARLLFTRGPLIRRAGLPYGDLWVYDTASGDLGQLTARQGFDGLGTWSP